ncbi:MAG: exonuclease SbcCD subunit D C-terminal domain-containing protein [Bacteroidota bacterium]
MNSFRLLHTSDWHLGQKFITKDRLQEHTLALDWLFDCIVEQQVEVLIVAGDIFDIGSPPNYARRLYYRFLTRLQQTNCRHIIITGGNHDSPAMLEAPKDLLQQLNVYVIGAVPADLQDEIILLRDQTGNLEAVVAAVPFLRDRDLKKAVAGETGIDRIERIKEGIREHYQDVGALLETYQNENIPIIVTGHLYASGAEVSGKQDNIYIGNKENIKAQHFPNVFDYVALGHIHRAQVIGGLKHIRYSGSIIPLSFSETKDDKSVYLLAFEGKELKDIQALQLPVFRRLKTLRGDFGEVKDKLAAFAEKHKDELKPWMEIIIETDTILPSAADELYALAKDLKVEILKLRVLRKTEIQSTEVASTQLEELDVLDVFRQKCMEFGTAPDNMEELEMTFRELQDWLAEEKVD